MLIPFQRYFFYTSSTVKDLHRKFLLLLEQKNSSARNRVLVKKGEVTRTPLYTGTIEGDLMTLNSHKYNGDEDIVRISGQIKAKGNVQCIEIRLLITNSYLVAFAAGIVIALAAAYMYTFIGVRFFNLVFYNGIIPYLVLVATAIYINLRRYSNKAAAMLEHIIYWLELEEEE